MGAADERYFQGDVELTQETTVEVADDGTVITEDTLVAYDVQTGTAVIDDVIDTQAPDGSEVIDEIVAVVDSGGEAEVLAEEVTSYPPDWDRAQSVARLAAAKDSKELL